MIKANDIRIKYLAAVSVIFVAQCFIQFYFALNNFTYNDVTKLFTECKQLSMAWHVLDLDSLKLDPFRSIFYLHSQPPLFNIVISILSQFPHDLCNTVVLFNAFLISCTSLLTYLISRKIGLGGVVSCLCSATFAFAPGTLLNVAFPFYPVFCCFLILSAIAALILVNDKTKSALLAAVCLTLLCLLRSSYSLPHLILCFAFILWLKHIKNVAAAISIAVVLFALPVGVAVKNYAVFGFFGLSSWTYANLANAIPHEGFPPFQDPAVTMAQYPPPLDCSQYPPVVTDTRKNHGQTFNHNHCTYLYYPKIVIQESLKQFSLKAYMVRVLRNISMWASSPDRYFDLWERPKIEDYANLFNRTLMLEKEIRFMYRDVMQSRFIRFGLWIAVAGFVVLYCRRLKVAGLDDRNKHLAVLCFFLCMNFFTSVLTDGWEADRFVFDIEPVLLMLYFYTISQIFISIGKLSIFRITPPHSAKE